MSKIGSEQFFVNPEEGTTEGSCIGILRARFFAALRMTGTARLFTLFRVTNTRQPNNPSLVFKKEAALDRTASLPLYYQHIN